MNSPVIISASRRTDIPAFFAGKFMEAFRRLTLSYPNPYNGKEVLVSLSKLRLIVFWTKNPEPIIEYLPEIEAAGVHYYFQFTLNDYENEGFEPCLPSISERIGTFKRLSRKIGKEKIIWRFDPLILCDGLRPRDLVKRISEIGNQLVRFTDKLVISFVDIMAYRRVRLRLIKASGHFNSQNIESAEFSQNDQIEFASELSAVLDGWRRINPDFHCATCAEAVSLEKYSIGHNSCIDGKLILRLFPDDRALSEYICPNANLKKDPSQRKNCLCIKSTDIGQYNSCRHGCLYCYANP